MVFLNDIDQFEQKAKELFRVSPGKTRLSTKYKKTGPVFTMKVTDGKQCYRLKITKDAGVKQAQKVIASLMHLITSSELIAKNG